MRLPTAVTRFVATTTPFSHQAEIKSYHHGFWIGMIAKIPGFVSSGRRNAHPQPISGVAKMHSYRRRRPGICKRVVRKAVEV